MAARARGLKTKIFLSLAVPAVLFGLLEVGLRAVRPLLLFKLGHTEILYKPVKKSVDLRILCVGDSYTVGGNVEPEETYPSQLRPRLANAMARMSDIDVVNEGICEANTSETLSVLPGLLDKYKPNIVILLAGSTNRHNPLGRPRKRGDPVPIREWLARSRVVQTARVSWVNWRNRLFVSRSMAPFRTDDIYFTAPRWATPTRTDLWAGDVDKWTQINAPRDGDALHNAWYDFNAGRKAEAKTALRKALDQNEVDEFDALASLALFDFLTQDLAGAEAALTRAAQRFPRSPRNRNLQALFGRYTGDAYRHRMIGEQAIRWYLWAIAADPNESNNYYWMTKVFDYQAGYDAATIYAELSRLLAENPILAESRIFSDYLNLYRDKEGWEKQIEPWVYDDLSAMARLCRERGVRLVVQNYPLDYPLANRLLKQMAAENALPFVDNRSVFETLEPWEKYFSDEDHCTVEGHRVMVENITRVLIDSAAIPGLADRPAAGVAATTLPGS